MRARASRIAAWQIATLVAVMLVGAIVISQTTFAPASRSDTDAPIKSSDLTWGALGETCHAYPARLMSEHPLYPQLMRLDAEIARFSSLTVHRWERRWHWGPRPDSTLVLIGPQPPGFDSVTYDDYVTLWRQSRTNAFAASPSELAPDLMARLGWIEQQLRGDLEQKLQATRYAEQLELSRKEADLVRKYQEALMNADLMVRRRGESTDAAPSERERILARIEAQMAEQADASQRLLDEYEARMRQEAQLAFDTAQQQVWQKMQKRLHSSVSSGSKTADRLSKLLSNWEVPDYSGRVLVHQSSAVDVLTHEYEPGGTDVEAVYASAGNRLAAMLSVQKSRLSRRIYDETVLAVRKSALEAGTRLTVPPTQPTAGPDVTEQLRPQLRRMWQS